MAHNFFRQKQTTDKKDSTESSSNKREREMIFVFDADKAGFDFKDPEDFKDPVAKGHVALEDPVAKGHVALEDPVALETDKEKVTNPVKGLQEVSLGLGSDPILVPEKRTQFGEIKIVLENMSVTMNQILKHTEDIEKNILLTESNNNISDSETKTFIEMTINKHLEQFKNFITTNYFKDEEIENLGHNDIIIIVNNAPSKQMLKINSKTANNIINDILIRGGKCYITDNMNKKNLSQQIKEIEQAEILERKEDTNSRKQRININSESINSESESELDSDKEREEVRKQRMNINFASDEEGDDRDRKEIETILSLFPK